MKKILCIAAVLAACALPALAVMDDVTYSMGAATGTAVTAKSYVIRGELEAIQVSISAGATCSVTVADSFGRVFEKTNITASTAYYPRIAVQTTAGAAYTFEAVGSAGDGTGFTNYTFTSAQSDKIPLASAVTVTVTNAIAVATTNTATIKLIVNK